LPGARAHRYPRAVRTYILLLAAVLVAGPALAAEPLAAGIPDLVGPRTLGLSAGVGLVTSNDGIFVNPGALAARKRYSVEAAWLLDRRGADNTAQFVGTSIVDSVSSSVAAAVAYTRVPTGEYEGHLTHLAIAFPLAERMYLGATGKYLKLDGPEDVGAVTLDAGLFWELARYVTIGAAGYNLVPVAHEAVAPMGVGAGLTLGSEQSFQVTGEWRADFDRSPEGETKNRYGAGAEYLIAQLVAVRAGFQRDEVLDTDWWSAGVGVLRGRVALDAGYRQSLDDATSRQLGVSLRVFMFE
jgi:hypothetical protein